MAYGSVRYGGAPYAGAGAGGTTPPAEPTTEESGSLAVASQPVVAGAFFPGAPR